MGRYDEELKDSVREQIRNEVDPQRVNDEGFGTYSVVGADGKRHELSGYNLEPLIELATLKRIDEMSEGMGGVSQAVLAKTGAKYSDDDKNRVRDEIWNEMNPVKISDEGFGIYEVTGVDGERFEMSGYNLHPIVELRTIERLDNMSAGLNGQSQQEVSVNNAKGFDAYVDPGGNDRKHKVMSHGLMSHEEGGVSKQFSEDGHVSAAGALREYDASEDVSFGVTTKDIPESSPRFDGFELM